MKKGILLILLFLPTLTFTQILGGKIIEEHTPNVGVPFAKIHFVDLDRTIIADSTGYWEINDAPVGINHVIVSASGYKAIHKDITLSDNGICYILLEKNHHELDKVIVSNNGYLHRESITNVESHKLADLNKIPVTTLGEAIANIPGVYQTGVGVGISKPVIRGLSGASVVTYVNSLRIENQQWGGDHGLPVTSLGIGGVEVIKGPASLLYGADALGGVLYFVDEPYAQHGSFDGYISTRFEHNSLGTGNQAGFRYTKEKFKFNIYGGYDNFADYGVPNANGQQILNSRFNQYSGKLAMGYSKKNWVFNLRYNFYKGRIGLPGHTHDSIPDVSSFLTDNQNRSENVPAQNITNHFVSVENKFFFKNQEVFITLGNTFNSLKEHEEKFFFPDIVMTLNNSLYNIKWRARMKNYWEAIIGSQGMYQVNRNDPTAPEILIPNSETIDAGLYGLLRFNYKNWRILMGGRFDYRTIGTAENDFSFTGINYSSGFAYLGDQSTVRFNVSSGFRAPTSSELLADGIHHGTFRYEIGNTSLETEKAIQLDASYALHFEDLELIVNPFYNRIQNYIYIEQIDSIIDNFKVFEYTQAAFAQLYGLDFGFHYHPHRAHWLHIESSFSNVFAEDNNKSPIPMIPQTRINSQLMFEFHMDGKFQIENVVIQHQYFFKQNRLATLETFTPDYHLINLAVNMKLDLKTPIIMSVGVRNLLNQHYIDHLSGLKNLGLPNPGVNAFFSARYEFGGAIKNQTK